MTVQDIFTALCQLAPLETALSYDNPGLLVGNAEDKVQKCVVALDCTTSVLQTAQQLGAQLIVTHHPVIFNPLRAVTATGEDSRVYRCIRAGVAVISMHTNLDSAAGGVNSCLAEALGLLKVKPVVENDGFVFRLGELPQPLTAKELAAFVGQRLQTKVRYVAGGPVRTVAVCGGSGADLLQTARQNGADALVTADVKHSAFIAALEQNFTLLDAGHYQTENTVIQPLCRYLRQQCAGGEFFSAELPILAV